METATVCVPVSEAKRFVADCLIATDADPTHATEMADVLIEADHRGHYSHGINRLDLYVKNLQNGAVDGKIKPVILKETVAVAWVDGRNGLGAVVGNYAMNLAIQKAKAVGIGAVSVKRSNHYGIAGWYTTMAQRQGLIGMSMTNTSKVMSPTRSKGTALGTNPISFAAPAKNEDRFVLDMATTTVAAGKIEMKIMRNEPCPSGWVQDAEGRPITEPKVALHALSLTPLGGSEETSGYKGYGISLMVEMLCSVLSGSQLSFEVGNWYKRISESANLGQFFLAIDPKFFDPDFEKNSSKQLNYLREMPRVDQDVPVIVPGDRSNAHKVKVDTNGGITYTVNQINSFNQMAERLGVKPIETL